MKLTQLVRVQNCHSRGRRFDSGKSPKTDNSNLQGFEVHRPLSKDTRLLRLFQVQVKQTIINQPPSTHVDNGMRHMRYLGQWAKDTCTEYNYRELQRAINFDAITVALRALSLI